MEIGKMTTKGLVIYLISKVERLEEEVDGLGKSHSNHLKHHWAITLAALTTAFTALGSLVIGIILLFVKSKIGG